MLTVVSPLSLYRMKRRVAHQEMEEERRVKRVKENGRKEDSKEERNDT